MNGVPESSDDENAELEEDEEKEKESEVGSEEEIERQKPSLKKSSAKKDSSDEVRMKKNTTPMKSSLKPKETPTKSQSGCLKVNNNSDSSPKLLSGKKKYEVIPKKKSSNPEKAATIEKSRKRVVKGKDRRKEDKVNPSDEDLQNAIHEILKEVDFNTELLVDVTGARLNNNQLLDASLLAHAPWFIICPFNSSDTFSRVFELKTTVSVQTM